MRSIFAFALLPLVAALPASAAPALQLQTTLSGSSLVFSSFGPVAPLAAASVAIGIEDGAGVYQLGLEGAWMRTEQPDFTQPSDGTSASGSVVSHTWVAAIVPGYRRYLGDFEERFSPFVEGGVVLGIGRQNWGFNPTSGGTVTSFLYGASLGLGGEYRFSERFGVVAQLVASWRATRLDSAQESSTQLLDLGSKGGVTLRF